MHFFNSCAGTYFFFLGRTTQPNLKLYVANEKLNKMIRASKARDITNRF